MKNDILKHLVVLSTVLVLVGCGGSSESDSTLISTTDVTVERGKVYDATVIDSSVSSKTAVQKANSNVYTFTGNITYPVKATGGWIDVNDDGKMDVGDIKLDVEMISYSDVITPITTYIADADKTLRDKKVQEMIENFKDSSFGGVTANELVNKVPSESSIDSIILANAIYENMKINTTLDKSDIFNTANSISNDISTNNPSLLKASSSDMAKSIENSVLKDLLEQEQITKVTDVMVEAFNSLNDNNDKDKDKDITKDIPALSAAFTFTPKEGTAPFTVSLDATSSIGDIVSYEWEIYNTGSGTPQTITANGITTSLTFTNEPSVAQNKDIYLTVTDTKGNKKTISKQVYIARKASAAFYFESGSCDKEKELVKVNGVNSIGEGLTYTWTVSTGGILVETSKLNGHLATFSFAKAGTYEITLSVKDKYNNPVATQTKSKTVTLEDCKLKSTAVAVDDIFRLSGHVEFQNTEKESELYTIDVLANDTGNIGKIISIDTPVISAGKPYIAEDKKSILLSLGFYPVLGNYSNSSNGYTAVDYSFTYTAEDLSTGGTITGTVTVDINPTKITNIWRDLHDHWHKDVASVTRGISSIYNYTVLKNDGKSLQYKAISNDVSVVPTDWKIVTSTTYANGIANGPYEIYSGEYFYDKDNKISTCATKVGEYNNGSRKGTTLNYFSQSYSSNKPCELRTSVAVNYD